MTIASVADIIRTHGEGRSDKAALEFEGRTISFGDLYRRSCQVAQALQSIGVGPQDRVAFIGISDQWRFGPDCVNLAMMPMFEPAQLGRP